MSEEQVISALRETTETLTAHVGGRGDSLADLLGQLPVRGRRMPTRRMLPAILAAGAVAASVSGVALVASHVGDPLRALVAPGTGTTAPQTPVRIYDPANGWSHRTVTGIDDLLEVTSE